MPAAPPHVRRRRGHRTGAFLASILVIAAALAALTAGGTAATARETGLARHQDALISARLIARRPAGQVAAELKNARIAPGDPALGAGTVRYGVLAYRVVYRTVDAAGRPTRASGLVAFPLGRSGLLHVVDYDHGTTADKSDVPSSFGLDSSGDGIEGRWAGELFASAGLAVAEPDYVGMGESPGRPEYLVTRTEVSATLDLLRAAAQIARQRGVTLAPGILVTGFSQGGAAAMAVGRALQQGAAPGFRLRALAPVSGPYDLLGAELPGIFNGQVAAGVAAYYVAYLLTAWNPVYHLYAAPGDVFRRPYAARVAALFDGSHTDQQIIASMPPTLPNLLTSGFLPRLRHPAGVLGRALRLNSTCTGWTPRVPVRLYAASGDQTVTQVNALHCRQALRLRGTRVQLVQLGAVDHDVSDFLALPRIVRWFLTYR